jgi:ribonuclease E
VAESPAPDAVQMPLVMSASADVVQHHVPVAEAPPPVIRHVEAPRPEPVAEPVAMQAAPAAVPMPEPVAPPPMPVAMVEAAPPPAPVVAPQPIKVDLSGSLEQAGLVMIETAAEKKARLEAPVVEQPQLGRKPKPVVVIADEPLQIIETRRE